MQFKSPYLAYGKHFDSFPGWLGDEELSASAGDPGSVSGLERSPGDGNGNPLQYSCLENSWTEEPGGLQSMGSQKSWIQLSN